MTRPIPDIESDLKAANAEEDRLLKELEAIQERRDAIVEELASARLEYMRATYPEAVWTKSPGYGTWFVVRITRSAIFLRDQSNADETRYGPDGFKHGSKPRHLYGAGRPQIDYAACLRAWEAKRAEMKETR